MGLSGHCLCGAVKYTVDADPLIVGYDHCDDCQRQTGSTYCTPAPYSSHEYYQYYPLKTWPLEI